MLVTWLTNKTLNLGLTLTFPVSYLTSESCKNMGRKRIDRLEYIEKPSDRSSSFSKNKMSFYDKAVEFARMHGAEVHVVITSEKNITHSFSTRPNPVQIVINPDDQRDNRRRHTTFGQVMEVCLTPLIMSPALNL